MQDFIKDVKEWLTNLNIKFVNKGMNFYFPDKNFSLTAISMGTFNTKSTNPNIYELASEINNIQTPHIYLYEDRWWHSPLLCKGHILSRLGMVQNVFARNCEAKIISTQEANDFLNIHHDYGAAKAKYKYGLFLKKAPFAMVAVATFSSPRKMNREGPILSYEWIRYASTINIRVIGGMGKLMAAFVKDIAPDEIMSYSDSEWSQGESYRKLGFKEVKGHPPVPFVVYKETMERVSFSKLRRVQSDFDTLLKSEGVFTIYNMGSRKWLHNF
jgi:hypothetical protein